MGVGARGGSWVTALEMLKRASLSTSATFVVRVTSFATRAGSLFYFVGGGGVLAAFLAACSSFRSRKIQAETA